MKFDENLREFRKEKGYSQEELSVKLGVTRQTVSKWENGSAMPDLKKLTELAEFFGVSMDELLGIEHGSNSSGSNENNFEIYSQYIDQRISAFEAVQKRDRNKDIKILSVLFCLALAVIAIWVMIFTSYVKSSINNLDYSVRFLQSQINNFDYPSGGNDNYWENKSDDVTVSYLSVDPEKPYIVETEFRYSPSSYAKNSKVYFSIPTEDGGVEKLEATEINGEFVLTTDIDFMIDGSFYFYLDDGEEIIKEEIYADKYSYCDFTAHGFSVYYRVDKGQGFMNTEYTLKNIFDHYEMYFSTIATNEITDAEFIVESGNEELFSQKLEVTRSQDGNGYDIRLSDYSIDTKLPDNIMACVKITDELGTVYKYYVSIDSDYGYSGGNIVIQFSNGVTIGEFDPLM